MKCLHLLLLLFVPGLRSEYNNSTWKYGSYPCTDKNHLFLAPGVLTAGGTNRACISRFYSEGTARIQLMLRTEDNQTVVATRELPPGDGGCVDIAVPLLPNTKAELIVNVKYPEVQCNWERRLTVRIASGRVVMVHTEKAKYRPGETLKARIFVVKADLTPAHSIIEEIWLEGPPGAWEGTRVTEWTKVRSKMGLAQVQYEIDEMAPTGRWTIRARLGDGSQGSASFWVGNYELPPFQLTVRHSKKVLRTTERLVWTVCVRYPWGEGGAGMLVVRMRGAGGAGGPGGAGGGTGSGGVRTALRLRRPRACHTHALAASRLPLTGPNAPDVVVADFSFQEEGTRVWQNTTVVSQIVDKPLYLHFVTKPTTVLSPGLPYKVKVKAVRWDDKPAPNHRIRVCRSTAADETNTQICTTGDTDATGIARIIFEAEDSSSPLYTFEATLYNDTTVFATPITLVTRQSHTQAALGPMRADTKGIRTFVPLYLSLQNTSVPVTVHFVVITRGGIIYRWGATTQCPIDNSSPYIQIAQRNGKCDSLPQLDDKKSSNNNSSVDKTVSNSYKNKNNYEKNDVTEKLTENDINSIHFEANVSDSLLNRHLLRIMLPIKVTQQMCPDSHLIAYFYYNGEFVSASKHFEMDDCFVNKVELSFSSRQVLPGAGVRVRVRGAGGAVCALRATDPAPRARAPLDRLLVRALTQLMDAHRNVTQYDAAGDCFLNTENPEPPKDSLELTASWLASAGVRTVGDMRVTRHCDPPALLIDEGTVPRTDFSETWLWKLVTIGTNGSVTTTATAPDSITRYEANVVCLSKTGIAISPPAVLQVFREFFIHANGPKRLRRGDNTIIKYRLFNYLYEPISVQIQIITSPNLQGPSSVVESVCVEARGAAARRASIQATAAGNASLSIRAKAVADGACGNGTARRGVSDEVVISITVEPEGVPVHEYKSTLICGDDILSSKSLANWTWSPVEAVPGTESLTVWAAGDMKGPLFADADSLVLLPRGCGEQNMARLATNLLALSLLHPTSPAAITATEHVARGYTRQLQYVHPSGGFSAFGSSDASASTWLTAFVLRYFRKAHQVLWPNTPVPVAIERAEQWLLNQQMENGCFRNEGQVFHRELRGGLNEEGEISSIALTAYVITSLIEGNCYLPPKVVRNTLSCLRALPALKYKTQSRVYAHALLAYAFVKLKSYEEDLRKTNDVISYLKKDGLKENEGLIEVMELIKMAKRDGEFMWWETSSLSSSVEATSYALLSLGAGARALRSYGGAALRWLAAHRRPDGGFLSTQDTLVALEALTAWSSLHHTSTNLTVTATSGNLTRNVHIQPDDKIPYIMQMKGDNLTVQVNGTGCALIQATRSYNTLSSLRNDHKRLSVQVSVHTDGLFDCDSTGNNCFCAATVEACVVWSGNFPEMALLEISLPGGFSADASKLYAQLQEPDTLIRRIELSPSGSKCVLYLSSSDASDATRGHACARVAAVGGGGRTQPAHIRVLDYYHPAHTHTQVYTIPEDCPAQITHDSTPDLKDNVYNRARSSSNGDEILITNEFTFEDIPEGIPLEDPLYENLRLKNDLRKGKNNGIFTNTEKTNDIKSLHLSTNNSITNTNIIEDNKYEGRDTINSNSESDKIISSQNKYNEKIVISEAVTSTPLNENSKIPQQHDITNVSEVNKTEIEKEDNIAIDFCNSKLTDFHVIDTDKDLEVPSGVEGPIPSVVLPPPGFIVPTNNVPPSDKFYQPQQYVGTPQNPMPLENPVPLQNPVPPTNLIPPKQSNFPPINFLSPPPLLAAPSDTYSWYRNYFKTPYYSRSRRN